MAKDFEHIVEREQRHAACARGRSVNRRVAEVALVKARRGVVQVLRVAAERVERARHARLCDAHPAVNKVNYPGLEQHPQHTRARDLFCNFGSIMSIDLVPGVDCFDVLNAMQTVVSSSNLGDTRTLAIPVAHTIFYEMGAERRASMGISDSMIRFSIGIEEEADLLADFTHALDAALAGK